MRAALVVVAFVAFSFVQIIADAGFDWIDRQAEKL
jgi:hypothetical protein